MDDAMASIADSHCLLQESYQRLGQINLVSRMMMAEVVQTDLARANAQPEEMQRTHLSATMISNNSSRGNR